MSAYLKTTVSLADIPNPHPVLMVGEVHDDHITSLYTLRSYKKLADNNYLAYAQEWQPSTNAHFDKYKKIFDKTRGKKNFTGVRHDSEAFEFTAICTQVIEAQNLGYSTHYIDMPHELGNHADDANINKASTALASSLSAQTAHLVATGGLSLKEAELHIRYAKFGPKTYANFQSQEPVAQLSPEFMEPVFGRILSLQCAHTETTKKSKRVAERDVHMAAELADLCQKIPAGKKILAYGGLGHMYDHRTHNLRGASITPYDGLPVTLAKNHAIQSTTLHFANPLKIIQATQRLQMSGIKKEYIDPAETMPFGHHLLGLNFVETHFFLNNISLEEKIHDLREAPVGVDYAIMGIKGTEEEFAGNINKKIAQQLGIK